MTFRVGAAMTGPTDGTRNTRVRTELRETMRTKLSRATLPVVGGVAVAAAMVVAAPAGAQADPPGNNGTVKVDGVVFDDHPNDEPHPGCTFQIDFYGFDAGDLSADVTFEAIDPTGAVDPLLTDSLSIGEDDNSGGGSEAGLDAARTFDLTSALTAITPHPQQGWHVKLTVNAEGSQGADTKFKVFWVSGCASTPPTSTPPTSTPSSSTTSSTEAHPPGSSTTSTTVKITPGGSTTIPSGGTPGGPSDPSSPVQPVDIEPTASSGGLPITGSNSLALAAVALGLVSVGAGVLVANRRRTSGDV